MSCEWPLSRLVTQLSEPAQDVSVNWDRPADVGRIEASTSAAPQVRRRVPVVADRLPQGCRMCNHLTATGQTRLRDVSREEFLEQADTVLDHYRRETPSARSVHFNFMARGEPLANPVLLDRADDLLAELAGRAVALGLRPRYLVSTILPREFGDRRLEDVFVTYHPEIYYSVYSMKEEFRRRWLPKALPVEEALDRLAAWQRATYKICKLHYAFIEGENDAETDVHAICDAVERRKLMVHVNIVSTTRPPPAASNRRKRSSTGTGTSIGRGCRTRGCEGSPGSASTSRPRAGCSWGRPADERRA